MKKFAKSLLEHSREPCKGLPLVPYEMSFYMIPNKTQYKLIETNATFKKSK